MQTTYNKRLIKIIQAWGGCIAERKHSCFPPSSPGFESCLYQDYFPLLLSLWTVLRSNPSSAKKQISQMRLAVTSRANHYKNINQLVLQCSKSHQFEVVWQLSDTDTCNTFNTWSEVNLIGLGWVVSNTTGAGLGPFLTLLLWAEARDPEPESFLSWDRELGGLDSLLDELVELEEELASLEPEPPSGLTLHCRVCWGGTWLNMLLL